MLFINTSNREKKYAINTSVCGNVLIIKIKEVRLFDTSQRQIQKNNQFSNLSGRLFVSEVVA